MTYEKEKIEEGDFVRGSWRDNATGKTYYTEGTAKFFPAGMFIQEENNGGITPLTDFFFISEIRKTHQYKHLHSITLKTKQ